MTRPDFRYDGSAAQVAAETVRLTHNKIVQLKTDMDTYLINLNNSWWGGASESAAKARKDWGNAADEIYAVLAELYKKLDIAHTDHTTLRLGLERMWGG